MYEPTNLPPTMVDMPSAEEKPSALGIAALLVGIVSLLSVCGTIALSIFSQGSASETFTNVLGLIAICSIGLCLLGVGLGIAGVVQKTQKKIMPIIGLILSIVALLSICGIMALGIAALSAMGM